MQWILDVRTLNLTVIAEITVLLFKNLHFSDVRSAANVPRVEWRDEGEPLSIRIR